MTTMPLDPTPSFAQMTTPRADAFGLRRLLSWRHVESDVRAREDRARLASEAAERATQDALMAARAAERTRDEFLARMSHELRTPLNAVIGFSRLLESNRGGNQRPEDIDLLKRVRTSGEQLLRLIEDVLDQARIERGHMDLSMKDTDIVAIANRVADYYRGEAAAKGVRLVAVLPASASPVDLDAARFEQVLRHLMDNAVKFTANGTIRVTLVTDAATGRPTRLAVSDTGIGIPEDAVDRIFQPFEQGDASHGRPYGGAGLGLPLARRLCGVMGCQLLVESVEGKGSKFTIRFPRPA